MPHVIVKLWPGKASAVALLGAVQGHAKFSTSTPSRFPHPYFAFPHLPHPIHYRHGVCVILP
jgi:hypothetical protein